MKTPRKGVTLIEALMAIFVTAIGLLSLLVLFPVGAFRMAQAITDDRAANLASDAFATMEALNIHNDPLIIGAYTAPGGLLVDLTTAAGYDGPSYPVYVDPFNSSPSLGGATGIGIPRRSVSFATTPALARYWFSLPDDLTYSNDGPYAGLATDPNRSPALQPTRDGIYTAAYMLRRPRFQVPSIVETAVVVYKNRGSIGGENAYQNIKFLDPALSPTEVQITPAAGQETPPIRKGSWILDATVLDVTGKNPEPHGYFYRVVNVTETGSGSMLIELATTPKQSTAAGGTGYGVLVVMENVVEVFEKGPGWKP